MTEVPEGQQSGSRDSLSVRVTCNLLPFRPNGDRVPVSYMLHRWGISQFAVGPGGLVLGILAARLGDWWLSIPSLAVGVYASVVSVLMIKGLWTLRKRRRARVVRSGQAPGSGGGDS